MVSFTDVFHRDARGVPPADDDAERPSSILSLPKSNKVREPSDHWTGHQLFYVFGMQAVGSFCISGGINFAIAYAMYGHQALQKSPIRLFRFPNTISGDAAVTVFISCVLTWFLTLLFVGGDIRGGKLQPIGFLPKPKQKWLRWYLFADAEQPLHSKGIKQWILYVLAQAVRALLFGIPLFLLTWPAAIGIMTSSTIGSHRGNDYYYNKRWTPQIFKLIFGGILGLLQSSCFSLIWMTSIGWRQTLVTSSLPTSNTSAQTPIVPSGHPPEMSQPVRSTLFSETTSPGAPILQRDLPNLNVTAEAPAGKIAGGLAPPLDHDHAIVLPGHV